MADETCQRCGEVGGDRRTLWMACFYEMNELDMPFDEVELQHAGFGVKIGEHSLPSFPQQRVSDFASDEGGDGRYQFYTLRVCKSCRADWMAAIKRWFMEMPAGEGDGDIPVREMGALRMISEAEYQRRHPGREPIRISKGSRR